MTPSDQNRSEPPDEPELDSLVLECIARVEREGEAALETFYSEHPRHAETLRRRVRLLRDAGLLGRERGDSEAFPERLGDFHLLRRLGGGGMGVVYAAEQRSLGRQVALKLIRPEHLYFPGARARFLREAQATARLAHPGIVPIHAVGEERGIPYLAMELVEGITLSAALAELAPADPNRLRGSDLLRAVATLSGVEPSAADRAAMPFAGSWFDVSAWIAREVAQALEHAHQRGVVHRDVKPSNVMLTSRGRVLLLDFGLASAEGADASTRSASPQGSLPYMAPEQIRGENTSFGPRTDVYALGVMLFEMVSLRRPFVAHDGSELRQKILDGRTPALRSLVPAGPRDLATVVAVAMAPETERRYASAADFARDLSHVLAHEPIEARPAGAWTQLLRWTRRNPAAAALVFLLLVVGPTLFGTQRHWAASRILEQRKRADDSLGRAREAIDYIVRVGGDMLRHTPTLEGESVAALAKAVEFLESTIELEPQDRELQLTLAQTLLRIASLQRRHGRLRDAAATANKGIAVLTPLATVGADDPFSPELARGHVVLGHTLMQLGEHQAALAAGEVARSIYARRSARDPDEPSKLRALAWALWELGLCHQAAGDLAAGEVSLREALAIERRLLGGIPGYTYDPARVADTILALGSVLREAGRLEEAEAAVREALSLMASHSSVESSNDFAFSQLARSHEELGRVLLDRGRLEEAELELRQALSQWSEVAGVFELVPEFESRRTNTKLTLGALLGRTGRSEEGEQLVRLAESDAARLCSAYPDTPNYRTLLARARSELAAAKPESR